MERTMYILGGFACGNPNLRKKLEDDVACFLSGENLVGEISTDDPLVISEKIFTNERAAFIWVGNAVPGPVYNFFANDPMGIALMRLYNITLGYLSINRRGIEKIVYCVNHSGKIHAEAKPKKKVKKK